MKRNMGKEIKDVGTLFIVIGCVFALAVIFVFGGGDSSPLGRIIDDHFIFITVGGLLCFLIGIIVRSIGKSKEAKDKDKQ
ncbi:hypothetical protein [Ruminococcus sp.]|uniref:hypothetical protein n=1 Tax=Ruminococcus sp. TaxID=41978 RepID=UPI0025D280C5|nr:hypothetical protein [Ruminococcus sp.]MBR1432675.1 hypothetical protein [Ruminococcus sp.]